MRVPDHFDRQDAEDDPDDYTHETLAQLMCSGLLWNEGLPLAAAGFQTYRYYKGWAKWG